MLKRAPKAFSQKDVEKGLKKLSEWVPNKKHTAITKTYAFPNFIAALAFLAKVTVHAEVMDHHPEVELKYGELTIKLSTDSVKGLTKSDFELASRIDGLSR